MKNLFEKFRLGNEKENLETVVQNIVNGVVFRGTNLWILILAILVASLGLNVNSTAVIIGAMLISPLMGPIMGIGLAMGMNDIALLKKAASNYFIATVVALSASTVFFILSPLNEAHSELLARTSPNIYDVLIALFGGLAGIVAVSSKNKGNVIPGVAIATALMPPLCTAGYGLATLQLEFFLGAFYLYIINTVFIALSTLMIVQLLHFPNKVFQNEKQEKFSRRIIWVVVMVTALPSIYFGYEFIQQERFVKSANSFINNEAHLEGDYLLNKKIDARNRKISLVFGGKEIKSAEADKLKSEMGKYNLTNVELEIKQGFSNLTVDEIKQNDGGYVQINEALAEKEMQINKLQATVDRINSNQKTAQDVFEELSVYYPSLKQAVIGPSLMIEKNQKQTQTTVAVLSFSEGISQSDKNKISSWLKLRMKVDSLTLIFGK